MFCKPKHSSLCGNPTENCHLTMHYELIHKLLVKEDGGEPQEDGGGEQ